MLQVTETTATLHYVGCTIDGLLDDRTRFMADALKAAVAVLRRQGTTEPFGVPPAAASTPRSIAAKYFLAAAVDPTHLESIFVSIVRS